ncbi:12920_t:CDS:2, partial [Acaulospora colombiana]
MAAVPVECSSEFPPGYGDFNIQSSDNVVFSFPRGVLSHALPMFKDMFAFGDAETSENQIPLIISENATTINQLLLYLDPLKDPAELTAETVHPKFKSKTSNANSVFARFSYHYQQVFDVCCVWEVAIKYQVPGMQQRFEKMVIGKDRNLQGLFAQEPMLVLSVAEKFNLSKIGDITMSFVARAPQDRVFTTKYPLTPLTVMQIMELRTERGRLLSEKFQGYLKDKSVSVKYGGSHPKHHDIFYENSESSDDCLYDGQAEGAQRTRLGIHVALRMYLEPSWSAVVLEVASMPQKCSTCQSTLLEDLSSGLHNPEGMQEGNEANLQKEYNFNRLKKEILSLEALPIPL